MKQDVIPSLMGEACADFTVLYCLVTHEEYLFAAWYDPAHRITVGCRAPLSEEWVTFQPEGFWIAERNRYSNITDYDSHNYLTLAIDAEGYIHLSGNMHVDPLIYYRSQKPLDIFSIQPGLSMVGERENRATYPLFFKDSEGQLLFRYRDGCSGNGDDITTAGMPKTNGGSACWKRRCSMAKGSAMAMPGRRWPGRMGTGTWSGCGERRRTVRPITTCPTPVAGICCTGKLLPGSH
ncbi:Uncharacterised protein [Raoultella terrigena]|uniref:Uncharacterized protein n=1 Tax=Raoultella terrigena TaxID=577 RepID=A0A3P8JSC3_RAOTE|nr:Uncharacterised protein [Raoultella terrigena]